MSTAVLPVPPGTRLLHIGPHKTGTSGLQAAFHRAREQLAEHGVVYAGRERQPAHAASAIAGGEPPGLERPTLAHWEELCAEVAAAGGRRVVISSERFSNADDHAARAVVDGLGGARVHVAITLRPLLKILPSQWQENIQNGASYSYEAWLEGVLGNAPHDQATSKFWRRHRHDALVERWGGVVGLDNTTVVVVDDADPPMLLRAFEKLVGLPSGQLVPEARIANRSLTLGEVELMRRFNVELGKCSWLAKPQRKVIRESVRRTMRKGYTPSPDEARILTPDWAVAAAAELGREMTENISKLGVRVIGDLSLLTWAPDTAAKVADLPRVPSSVAADAVLGAVLATRPPDESLLPVAPEDRPVREVRSVDLLRLLGRRALRRVPRQVRRG
jgi:hypothetical protein